VGRRIALQNVVCGSRRFERLEIGFHPGAPGGDLELLADSPGRLPLYSAPIPDGGVAAAGYRIALGSGVSPAVQGQWWGSLAAEDRQFVCAMLAALWGAVSSGGATADLSARERDAIAAAARDAARLSGGMGSAKQLARGIARRAGFLGRGAAPTAAA
jgi:hypothetical protein